jgi:hypothetical protein
MSSLVILNAHWVQLKIAIGAVEVAISRGRWIDPQAYG